MIDSQSTRIRRYISFGYGVLSSILVLSLRPLWQPFVAIAGIVILLTVWLVAYHNYRIARFDVRIVLPLHLGTFMIPFMPMAAGGFASEYSAGILAYGMIVIGLGVAAIPMILRERVYGLLATSILLIVLGGLLMFLSSVLLGVRLI